MIARCSENFLKSRRVFCKLGTSYQSLIQGMAVMSRANLPSCDSVCSNIGGYRPSYDDFMNISLGTLKSFCENRLGCFFNVTVDFNFDNQTWVRSDGTVILDFVWYNDAFPMYNDLLVLFLDMSRTISAEYMATTSPEKSPKNTLRNQVEGFYFCANDSLSQPNLKFGTYNKAKQHCSKILTPKICNNQLLVNRLTEIAVKSDQYDYHFNTRIRKVGHLDSKQDFI